MNNNIANSTTNGLPYVDNTEFTDFLEELREAYLFAGLPPGNALKAAIADYVDLFPKAA